MRRCTFRDETHSALKDIARSVSMIRRCNDSIASRTIHDALRNLKICARMIRHCDRLIRDDRRYLTTTGKNPTVWEMRELIAAYQGNKPSHFLSNGKPNSGYDKSFYGDFDANRNYVLHQGSNKFGKVILTMTRQEMERRFNEFQAEKNRNQANFGSAGYAGSGANNRANNGQMYGNIALPSDFYAPPEEKSRLLRALAFVNKAIKSTGEVIASLAGITAIGAAVANAKEIGGVVGSLKNWLVEKATNIKNMVSGNNQGGQRLRH